VRVDDICAEFPKDAFDVRFELEGNIARNAIAIGANSSHDRPTPKAPRMWFQNGDKLTQNWLVRVSASPDRTEFIRPFWQRMHVISHHDVLAARNTHHVERKKYGG
jgi:hypothetical protein